MTLYRLLFKVHVTHDYYASGESPDFTVTPLAGTWSTLNRHRLVFRQTESGAVVATPVNDQVEPLIEPDDPIHFIFGLVLNNPRFSNFTVLPAVKDGEIRLFSNAASPTALASGAVTPTRGIIRVDIDTPDPTLTLVVTNAVGETVRRAEVDSVEGKVGHSFDLSGVDEGLYTLSYTSGGVSQDRLFIKSSAAFGLFGLVHLSFGSGHSFDLANPPTLDVAFQAKAAPWKYYLVLKTPPADSSFEVRHVVSGGGEVVTFGAGQTVDPVDGNDTLLFESAADVRFRETPIGNLQLIQITNKNGSTVESVRIGNLPSPSPHLLKPDMYVYLPAVKSAS